MADDVRTMLRRALTKLASEKTRVDRQIAALKTALGALDGQPRPAAGRPARRTMSPAARKAIARKMKAYWAKRRGKKVATTKSKRRPG